jgi:hypothetical protein
MRAGALFVCCFCSENMRYADVRGRPCSLQRGVAPYSISAVAFRIAEGARDAKGPVDPAGLDASRQSRLVEVWYSAKSASPKALRATRLPPS